MGGKVTAGDVGVDPASSTQQESPVRRADAPFTPDHDCHDPGLAHLPPRVPGQQAVHIIQRVWLANRSKAPQQIIFRPARAAQIDVQPESALRHAFDPRLTIAPGRAGGSAQAFR